MKRKLQKKPWQGIAAKADDENVLTAPCGCIFRATQGYWLRTVDCSKHASLSTLAY